MEFQARRRGRSRRTWSAGRLEASAGLDPAGARQLHPRPGRSRRCSGRSAQGIFPSVGSVRARGTTVIIEDVAFPVERLADAAVDLTGLFAQARLPRGHRLRPRQGRQPALRHHPVLQRPGGRGPVRAASWTTWCALVVNALRRRAQGRARHRAQHGAVRGGRVGRRGARPSWPAQGPGRPRKPAQPRRHPQRRPPRPPGPPQAHARGGRGGGQVHRVRVLRAQVPQPRADPDAPPAHRGAPGDGPPGHHRRGPGRCCREPARTTYQYMGAGHLRRGRPVRHRLPGLHRHRRPDQAPAPHRPLRHGPCRRPERRRAISPGRAPGPAGPALRPPGPGPVRGRGPWRPSPACSGPRRARPPTSGATEMPRPAKGGCPGPAAEGAQAIYFPACISRHDGRPARGARRPQPARGAGDPGRAGRGAGCTSPTTPRASAAACRSPPRATPTPIATP